MSADEIRNYIMSMDYCDPAEVAEALERIANKLIELEARAETK